MQESNMKKDHILKINSIWLSAIYPSELLVHVYLNPVKKKYRHEITCLLWRSIDTTHEDAISVPSPPGSDASTPLGRIPCYEVWVAQQVIIMRTAQRPSISNGEKSGGEDN